MFEENLLKLPREIEVEDGKTKKINMVGLCLKWISSLEKWVIRYGTPKSNGKYEECDFKFMGIGDSPTEALENFERVIKNYGKK